MSTETRKPLPDRTDLDHAAFWEGTDRGELLARHCGDCGRHHWPPRLGCPHCGSDKVAWVRVAPRGKVFSWTVIHRSQTPGFEADTPYAVVLVELDAAAGVRMIGDLVGAPPAALRAALPVEAVLTHSADDTVTLVNWRPVSGATG